VTFNMPFRNDASQPILESDTAANPELIARRKAYAALTAAYDADPAQALYLDQVRRDAAAAHRHLEKTETQDVLDRLRATLIAREVG